jgi:hypothetical protein
MRGGCEIKSKKGCNCLKRRYLGMNFIKVDRDTRLWSGIIEFRTLQGRKSLKVKVVQSLPAVYQAE